MTGTKVGIRYKVGGDVSDFGPDEQAAFKARLQEHFSCYPPECHAVLRLTAASVNLDLEMVSTASDVSALTAMAQAAGSESLDTVSAVLGVTVDESPEVTVAQDVTVVVAVSGPSPPPPSPPPPLPPLSPGERLLPVVVQSMVVSAAVDDVDQAAYAQKMAGAFSGVVAADIDIEVQGWCAVSGVAAGEGGARVTATLALASVEGQLGVLESDLQNLTHASALLGVHVLASGAPSIEQLLLRAPSAPPPTAPPPGACANACRSKTCGFFLGKESLTMMGLILGHTYGQL